ncbi:cytochrome P450 [Streptomyces lacrimifluminis]|uniref:cytochrome P450 n=1 Tax=Streptomyces lacrimifluminis TaxID=1500077 RepID=UPI001E50EE51|nr:cytochrome P450 [Streptomyces lacrimifluminis]
MASNVAVLMFGGIETTEAMITNALLHLFRHPAQLTLVRDDVDLLDGAIESHRASNPAPPSWTATPPGTTVLGPAAIRRGDLVTVSLTGANRHLAVFPDPDRFDVRRENARLQLAFAHGPHHCLAERLARLEPASPSTASSNACPDCAWTRTTPPLCGGLVFRKPSALHVLWDAPA